MKFINQLFLSLIFICVASIANAQIDRTKAPKPTAAPEINIAKPYTFTLKNGLKVYVVENHKLPRIAFSLSLDRDPILEGEKAGYVSMAGQLLTKGTENRTKAELDAEIDFIGANLNASSTGVYASSLTTHTDKLLELMTDVLFNPAFPAEELEKLKKQTLSGLAASKDDPNAIASNVRGVLTYGNDHPYGEFTTEETVENITLEDCKKYYETYFRPNIGYLAIVGDITPKEAKKLIKKNFSKWENGSIPTIEYETPQAPEETYVALVDREASVQSVINVSYPVELKVGSEDAIKARVLNQILGGGFSSRLMQNLREDKAFTYGARSSLSNDKLIGNFNASASVRNEVTDSAVSEFMYELQKISQEEVTQNELDAAKASIAGSFARSLESPQTVASFAINTAIYNLSADYYNNYLKELEKVSLADIKAMATKYILPNHANIIVVGKDADVTKGLKQFGEVKYFDRNGNEYNPMDNMKIPEGVTAKTVLQDYFEALGGEEKLRSVENMKLVYDATFQGQNLYINEVKKDGAFKQEVGMTGMVITKTVVNGQEVKIVMQGQEVPLPEEAKKDVIAGAKIFPELYFEELGIGYELKSITDLDGEAAYAIEVTMPSGKTSTYYYSADSGYKLKTSTIQTGPQGEVTTSEEYSAYEDKNGVMIPTKKVLNQGFRINTTLKSIEFNVDLEEDTFLIK